MSEERERCPACGLFKPDADDKARVERAIPVLLAVLPLGGAIGVAGVGALLGLKPRCMWPTPEVCGEERAAMAAHKARMLRGQSKDGAA